jgi:urease accessory protein
MDHAIKGLEERLPRPRVRVAGGARVRLRDDRGTTRLAELWHHDPVRVLMPRPVDDVVPHVVVLNTAGGLVGGDAVSVAIELGPSARALATGQAAEKVYRSDGPTVEIANALSVADGAWLEWMPQETILFEGCRLRRRLTLSLEGRARCLAAEMVVFGRRARGETIATARFADRWDLRRDGRLVWTDALSLGPEAGAQLGASFAFGGAAAMATMVYAGQDAARHLDAVRALLAERTGIAATCLGEILILRALAADAAALRRDLAAVWRHLRAEAGGLPARLPRLWHI